MPPGLDAFLAAAMVTLPVGLACAALGRRLGVVAWPRKDRWHARPVPLLGGVAVAAGLAAGAMVTGDLPPRLTGLLALALVAGALGLGDDLSSLSPAARLAVETALAVGLVVLGLRLPLTSWAPIDALLAVLFVVAVTNAFNLIDNMDGLAAGVALVAATCRWALLAGEGDGPAPARPPP